MTGYITIQLEGPLTVSTDDGGKITPKGRKACGLIALLALAPGMRRSRKLLQDKLWSDRGEAQGAASLRQALTEIRRAFGAHKACLITDRWIVSLDPARVAVLEPHWGAFGDDETVILDGLDIRDPEFEDWLRDQRTHYENLAEAGRALPGSSSEDQAIHPAKLLVINRRSTAEGAYADMVAQTVSELGANHVAEPANSLAEMTSSSHVVALSVDPASSGTNGSARVLLFDPTTNRVIWRTALPFADRNLGNEIGRLQRLNTTSVAAIDSLGGLDGERVTAQNLCFTAIRTLYRLGAANIREADALFSRAYSIRPRGIYLAWRAFLRTFLLLERMTDCEQTTRSEMQEFVSKSLELEPYNSYVLSLCAHVHCMVHHDYLACYELATRSIGLNPANPIGWIERAIAEANIGEPARALDLAQYAVSIAGELPFRQHIELLSCVASVAAGKFDCARRHGALSHAFAPDFVAPMRFLTALYLEAGEEELAAQMSIKLKQHEPDFSMDLFCDRSYPTQTLRKAGLLDHVPGRQM